MLRSSVGSGSSQEFQLLMRLGLHEKERKKHFNYRLILRQLYPTNQWEATVDFFQDLPYFFWSFFIEAIIIPSYRPEWAYYSTWQLRPSKSSENLNLGNQLEKRIKRKRRKILRLTNTVPRPVQHNHVQCQIVTINVSGKIYQTQWRTLDVFPNTLLANYTRMQQFYDSFRDDFFFDRNRTCFDAILYFYQSRGILRRPYNVSLEMFEEEIMFFELGKDVLDKFRREQGIVVDVDKPIPRKLFQRKIWLLFEYPESSKQARLVAILSIFVVTLSIFIFCVETISVFKEEPLTRGNDLEEEALHSNQQTLNDPFYFTETICIIWFTIELLVRFLSAPRKTVFIQSISNLIDFVAIIPYFMTLVIKPSDSHKNTTTSFTIFRVVKLVRVFRILKLSRHNRGLKVLGKTLKASLRELGLLMFFLVIGIILFSSAVYFADLHDPDTDYHSIIGAFWWSVITMTTCGYGDDVPKTHPGKIVGALCAIAGVLTLALPVPVIVSNFNNFYTRDEEGVHGMEDFEHIQQCPYRSATMRIEDALIVDSDTDIVTTPVKLIGENKPDDSDSDFEPLRKRDYENYKEARQGIRKLNRSIDVPRTPSFQLQSHFQRKRKNSFVRNSFTMPTLEEPKRIDPPATPKI